MGIFALLQPCTHVFGNVVGVEGTTVAISKDGFCLVVVADNDKAVVVVNIENI